MKWEKITEYTHPEYFSGIYKITSYRWHNNGPVKQYYQAYYIPDGYKHWGNYVDRSQQYDKMLTLKQCKALCEAHAQEHTPSKATITQAEKAKNTYYPKETAA